ncbi:MAG: hypothetical protein R3190_14340, partial [Thermoanaerobaculia bacterium]|nr:hypothetical protein [Thermoanaerobaculia bacterium]
MDTPAPSRLAQAAGHATACALLLLVLLIRFFPSVTSTAALGDEAIYFRAFDRVRVEASPYEVPNYYYFPVFATTGALLVDTLGPGATLFLLRATNLV